MELLIALLVFLIVAGVVWWAINAIARAFNLPRQIVIVIQVLFVLVCLIALLNHTGYVHLGNL